MVGRYSDGDDYKVLFDNEKESKQSQDSASCHQIIAVSYLRSENKKIGVFYVEFSKTKVTEETTQ